MESYSETTFMVVEKDNAHMIFLLKHVSPSNGRLKSISSCGRQFLGIGNLNNILVHIDIPYYIHSQSSYYRVSC